MLLWLYKCFYEWISFSLIYSKGFRKKTKNLIQNLNGMAISPMRSVSYPTSLPPSPDFCRLDYLGFYLSSWWVFISENKSLQKFWMLKLLTTIFYRRVSPKIMMLCIGDNATVSRMILLLFLQIQLKPF